MLLVILKLFLQHAFLCLKLQNYLNMHSSRRTEGKMFKIRPGPKHSQIFLRDNETKSTCAPNSAAFFFSTLWFDPSRYYNQQTQQRPSFKELMSVFPFPLFTLICWGTSPTTNFSVPIIRMTVCWQKTAHRVPQLINSHRGWRLKN